MNRTNIINDKIVQFAREMQALQVNGCVTVPASGVEELLWAMQVAELVFGDTALPDRIPFLHIRPDTKTGRIEAPTILVVTEEDYSNHPDWRERIKDVCDYFLNVE